MAQSLLTKESPEIRQFFRNIDTLSRLLDIQAEKFRPLLNGDRYMTDSELAGKLKLTRRTLADYRLNGKNTLLQDRRQIIVQGERCPGIVGNQPDGSVRLNPAPRLSTGRFSSPWQTAIHIVFQFLPAKVAFCLRLGKAVLWTGWKKKSSSLRSGIFSFQALRNHGKKQTGAYKK